MPKSVVLCPNCKVPMVYVQEVERVGNERRIVRYYKCPACGAKIMDEVLKIIRVNGSVKLIAEQAPARFVEGNRRPAPRHSSHPRRSSRHSR